MRHRLRNTALTVVLGVLRTTLRLLSRVVPQSRSVVVSAHPETEGNGLEVARALVRRYPGRVVWLCESGATPVEVQALAGLGVVLTTKASLAGLWAYLRAEAVFFTHGLYGSPRPCARKPIVNLFHGDGPKDIRPDRGAGALLASTYLVGSTTLFSGFQASAFKVPADRLLVTGNPRTDQFWEPFDRERLTQLGITGDFVVWMPTFRRARAVGAMRVRAEDRQPGAEDTDVGVTELIEELGRRHLQLVIKPHPLDADRRQFLGALTIANEDLVHAGVTPYALLGASSGLVTDYSSVWVDYLLLDRPLAFLVPDRHTYARELLPPDVLDWAPGEVVDLAGHPFATFLADLDSGGAAGAALRQQASRRIGLNPTRQAADDLLTTLAQRGVLRTSTPARGPAS